MSGRALVAAAVTLAVLAMPAAPVRAAPLPLAAAESLPAAEPALEAALLDATNRARAAHGLRPLAQDEGLARAARGHAAEMARLQYFSHGSPVAAHDGLPRRLALAGSPLTDVAENIVMLGEPGATTTAAQTAVDDWLHSPPHRANLLNGSYDVVGFGAATDTDGRLFMVQDFGSQPAELLAYQLVPSSRVVSEVRLEVDASAAVKVLFRLGADAPVTRSLPAGRSTVVLVSDAEGSVRLIAGVARGANDYLEDAGGTVDLQGGRYLPDPSQPRLRLTVAGVSVARRVERGARLSLDYRPPPGDTLALFLAGSYQPQARTAPGRFALFLPDTLGDATVGVGVEGTGNAVAIVHRFHLDPGAAEPKLLAGAAR